MKIRFAANHIFVIVVVGQSDFLKHAKSVNWMLLRQLWMDLIRFKGRRSSIIISHSRRKCRSSMRIRFAASQILVIVVGQSDFLNTCKISQLDVVEAVVDGFDQFQKLKKQHHHLA